MAFSLLVRADRGLGTVAIAGLLLPALVAAIGGFALQRVVVDDDPPAVALPANRHAVPVYDCPGDPTVADVRNGDRVFAIGVHEELDGWLLIRNPIEPSVQWWIENRYVATDSAIDDLPDLGCDDPVPEPTDEVAAPAETTTTTTEPEDEEVDEDDEQEVDADESTTTTDPDESTTTTRADGTTTTRPQSSTTSTTTRPSTTTTNTTTTSTSTTTTAAPRPDTSAPQISNFGRASSTIREDASGEFCDRSLPTSTRVWASVTDESSITSVSLSWFGGSSGNGSKSMSFTGGRWEATLGPFANGPSAGNAEQIQWTVTARDSAGNQSESSSLQPITIWGC